MNKETVHYKQDLSPGVRNMFAGESWMIFDNILKGFFFFNI